MRQSIGRKTWKTAVLMLLLLAVGIYLSVQLFSQSLSMVKAKSADGAYSARAAAFIWKQWYPSGSGGVSSIEEDTADSGGWLMQFILRQGPYYRIIENGSGGKRRQELDPAYRDYVENNRTLKEYEYLVKGLSESAVLTSGSNPLTAKKGAENQGDKHLIAGGTEGGNLISENEVPENPLSGSTDIAEQTGLTVTGTQYIEAQLADYDFLMKHFYSVHPTTTAGRDMMKAKTFLSEDLTLKSDNNKPQILIYHTHSQEEFADYGPGNKEATIVGVGTYLTELLTKKGYNVIHDTSVYDLQNGKLDRSKAYNYALDGVTGILQKYPSIEVVLDVHRDGVKAGTHLVQEVNGKQTASIMFFNGTSQTPTGPIEYLKNPYRTENLAFSFQMKLFADAYFPGFTRKIYLKGMRYNMHLRPRSALIEVGAQTNTYEEAINAMEPLSELLDMVLKSN